MSGCGCGKRTYLSRREARTDLRSLTAKVGPAATKGMRPYLCPDCEWLWHIGHLPEAVRRGRMSDTQWYASRPRTRPTGGSGQ